MQLSVNICSYKYGHLAAQAIESVLNQSVKADVIRFYDDGAGDCKHLPKIYPEVEFILRPNNLGIIDNFNDALDKTTTDRVMFLGADNWLHPKTFELCLERNEDIVSFDAVKIGDGMYEYWHLADFPHGSAMYNVELAKRFGYKHSGNEHPEEDHELFYKMIHNGKASLYIIEQPLLNYRWRHRLNFNK